MLLLPFLALDGGLALGAPPAASAALGALLALWALLGKRSLEALVQRLGAAPWTDADVGGWASLVCFWYQNGGHHHMGGAKTGTILRNSYGVWWCFELLG